MIDAKQAKNNLYNSAPQILDTLLWRIDSYSKRGESSLDFYLDKNLLEGDIEYIHNSLIKRGFTVKKSWLSIFFSWNEYKVSW